MSIVSTKQNWKCVFVFVCQENDNQKLRSESSFLCPLHPKVQFNVVLQHLNLRHTQNTYSCRRHVLNLHVLVSLYSWDSTGSCRLWEFLLLRVPHLLRFPFRHLHEIPQLVDVLTNWCCVSILSFRWTYERTAVPSPFLDC